MNSSVCFYFQVHQPYRLRKYTFFDIDNSHFYYDDISNKSILQKVAKKCYLPTNQLLLDLINQYDGKFKIAFSISGIALEQFEKYSPETLLSFQKLVKTGCVELLSETYYHSLAFLYSKNEFISQIDRHKQKIQELFDYQPTTFRNTELIYNNYLAKIIEDLGFQAILCEGADRILDWRSPNFVYKPQDCNTIKLLLKNYKLSDDIAFRFSNHDWPGFPLTADKFTHWVHNTHPFPDTINLFMDYETFGEHQWEDTGIFDFLKQLPEAIFRHPDYQFSTPCEVAQKYDPIAKLDIKDYVSWADMERDLSAWTGNDLQNDALQSVYQLESLVNEVNDKDLLHTWRTLQTSDHFYYMCTKWFADGDVHKYFNPYNCPYEAYINYNNILTDFKNTLMKGKK